MVQSIASAERAALCNLFEELGPDGPTLCKGWKTSDLAAHLYVRERRVDAVPGIVIQPLAGYTESAMRAVTKRLGYAGVVQKVRSGPPFPVNLFDRQFNTLEFFIHHEDVRRAQEEWEPREDRALDDALWGILRHYARVLAHSVTGAGLELVRSSGDKITARAGEPRAVITGDPQELAHYLHGRTSAARVAIEADRAAREALERAHLSP